MVGWGATIRELNVVAAQFDELVHIAPLHHVEAPDSSLPYTADNARFVPITPAGGSSVGEKISILWRVPSWLRVFRRELRSADVVHVRLPANVSFVGLVFLMTRRSPQLRWFKYADAWDDPRVPVTYRIQRWMLRRLSRLHRGFVAISGSPKPQPRHIVTLRNPTLTDDELETAARSRRLDGDELRLLFAGRVDREKGVLVAVGAAAELARRGRRVRLDVAGDGPLRGEVELTGSVDRLRVDFHGWIDRAQLNALYATAHFVLLPSTREGFPKVLAEGMAFGAVPLACDAGSVRVVLECEDVGTVIAQPSVQEFVDEIERICATPGCWEAESAKAIRAAKSFTYRNYTDAVLSLLRPDG